MTYSTQPTHMTDSMGLMVVAIGLFTHTMAYMVYVNTPQEHNSSMAVASSQAHIALNTTELQLLQLF